MAGAVVFLSLYYFYGRPNSRSYESLPTRFLRFTADTVPLPIKTRLNMYRLYADSRLNDLEAAAKSGRLIKKVTISKPGRVEYSGVALVLREWAQTNQVNILYCRTSRNRLKIYVRASDATRVEDYFDSLSDSDLSPFE